MASFKPCKKYLMARSGDYDLNRSGFAGGSNS